MTNRLPSYITTRLEERGWNTLDLASRCGISQAGISKILNRQHSPKIKTIVSLAGGLEVAPRALFEALGIDVDQIPPVKQDGDEVAG